MSRQEIRTDKQHKELFLYLDLDKIIEPAYTSNRLDKAFKSSDVMVDGTWTFFNFNSFWYLGEYIFKGLYESFVAKC